MCHPEVPEGTTPPNVRTAELTIAVGGGAMPTLVAFPERARAPAVLVINDVFGRSPFYEHTARRLAQAGFVAATPEFFFREGPLPEPTPDAAMARAEPIDLAAKMKGPILGHWGDQGAGVGMDNVKELDAALDAGGVEHEFHVYPGLGHGFLKASLDDEGTPGYRQACESWTRTIAFYDALL